MDIKKLLEASRIQWPGNEEDLIKDFNNIVDLIASLPEPKSSELSFSKNSCLFEDSENKEASKIDILEGDMFKI